MPRSSTPAPPHLEVERQPDDTVVLRWRWPDDATPRALSVEARTAGPDGPGVRSAEVPSAATGAVTFDGLPAHPRPWFVVDSGQGAHLLVAERRLPVDGTLNLRDLGGYTTDDGRRTVWGKVFRSDNFATVADAGWRQLHAMGLREVFDLRHDAERGRQPTVIPDDLDVAISVLAIGGEAAEAPDVVEMLRAGGADGFGIDFMVAMYEELVAEHAAVFATLLGHLADPARLPAVFHCTAGKDRTGIAAALLLRLLGVDREDVLDDYELSTRYRSGPRIEALRPQLEAAGVDVEAVRPFLSAPRPALAAGLDAIDRTAGGVEPFLLANGLGPDVPERLRALLLTP